MVLGKNGQIYEGNKDLNILRDITREVMLDWHYHNNSLREYTINILGYGNQGRQLVRELGMSIINPESKIKAINIWVRNNPDNLKDLLRNDFNSIPSESSDHEYQKVMDTIKFRNFRTLNDLSEIANKSKDTKNESDLLVILTRYDGLDNFLEKAKTKRDKLTNEEVMHNIQTCLFNAPSTYKQCEARINDLIERREDIDKILKDFKSMKRLGMLKYNLIGITELGKALEGYKGTALNIVNDSNISTYGFIAESGVPPNRVISPNDNDPARVKEVLYRIYNKYFASEFKGDLVIPGTHGPHGEFITLDRKSIFFNNKTFDQTFQSEADIVFEDLMTCVRNFGTDYAEQFGKTASDTVWNSLLPVIKTILIERNDKWHKGGVYHSDFQTVTGLYYKIQRGCRTETSATSEKSEHIDSEFIEATEKLKNLTDRLVENGHVKKVSAKDAPVMDVPKQKEKGVLGKFIDTQKDFSKRIEGIESMIKGINIENSSTTKKDTEMAVRLTNSLKAKIYMPSTEDNLVITKYEFDGNLRPLTTEYRISLAGIMKKGLTKEHLKMGFHDMIVKNGELCVLAKRWHDYGPHNEYRLFIFDEKTGERKSVSKLLGRGNEFEIGAFKTEDDFIFSGKEKEGSFLYKLNKSKNILEITEKTPEMYEMFLPTKNFDIRISDGSVYDSNKLLFSFKEGDRNGFYQVLPNFDILLYSTANKLHIYDLESNKKESSPSARFLNYAMETEDGIKIITGSEDGALDVSEYESKKELFKNNGKTTSISDEKLGRINTVYMHSSNLYFASLNSRNFFAIYHKGNDFEIKKLNISHFDIFGGKII